MRMRLLMRERRGVFQWGYFEKQLCICVSKGMSAVSRGGTHSGFTCPPGSAAVSSHSPVPFRLCDHRSEPALYVESFLLSFSNHLSIM